MLFSLFGIFLLNINFSKAASTDTFETTDVNEV